MFPHMEDTLLEVLVASSISRRTSWLVQMSMRVVERVGEEVGEMVRWM